MTRQEMIAELKSAGHVIPASWTTHEEVQLELISARFSRRELMLATGFAEALVTYCQPLERRLAALELAQLSSPPSDRRGSPRALAFWGV